jgi:hypothetical protein
MRFASASTCLNRGENVLATATLLYGEGFDMMQKTMSRFVGLGQLQREK